jgi:hypothetical protein
MTTYRPAFAAALSCHDGVGDFLVGAVAAGAAGEVAEVVDHDDVWWVSALDGELGHQDGEVFSPEAVLVADVDVGQPAIRRRRRWRWGGGRGRCAATGRRPLRGSSPATGTGCGGRACCSEVAQEHGLPGSGLGQDDDDLAGQQSGQDGLVQAGEPGLAGRRWSRGRSGTPRRPRPWRTLACRPLRTAAAGRLSRCARRRGGGLGSPPVPLGQQVLGPVALASIQAGQVQDAGAAADALFEFLGRALTGFVGIEAEVDPLGVGQDGVEFARGWREFRPGIRRRSCGRVPRWRAGSWARIIPSNSPSVMMTSSAPSSRSALNSRGSSPGPVMYLPPLLSPQARPRIWMVCPRRR